MGVLLCAVTKSCGQVRALVTLSSRPCCRGGVRACVVCAYFATVTWTGREVSITIRVLDPRSILRQAPIVGLQCPTVFGHKENPHHPAGQWGQPRIRTDQPTTTPAPRPRTATTGQPGPRQHTPTSRDRRSPRLLERDLTNKPVLSDLHLLLELLSHTFRLRTKTPVNTNSPTARLHPRLPHLDTGPVLRVVTGMVLRVR